MGTTQIKTRDAYGVTYADPTEPDFTVRFKTSNSVKNLNGLKVDNYVTEVIINDNEEITVGNVTANDAIAVRLRISGSSKSHARLKAIVAQLALQVDAWMNENVSLGFEPTSAPVNPVHP